MSALRPKSWTSAAALAMAEIQPTDRAILTILEELGPNGGTMDEILAKNPSLTNVSVSPRFMPLERMGLVYRTGDARPGLAGRPQKVVRHIKFFTGSEGLRLPPIKRSGLLVGLMNAGEILMRVTTLEDARRLLKVAITHEVERLRPGSGSS